MDLCSKEGAAKIAATIKAYWKARGADVSTWVERAGEEGQEATIHAVRPSLVGGLPR